MVCSVPTMRADELNACTAGAVWFPRARSVEIRVEALPPVGQNEVRIRALASSISSGTEMLVYRGEVPEGMPLDLPTLEGSYAFPIKYGYASVGRVVETGSAVGDLREGDLVFTLHPHQTEYVVSASLPVLLPPDLPPENGVFFANLETAITVALDAHPRLGERVVIFGQGVVGLLLTRLMRMIGAGVIIAIDPFERRQVAAREMGADVALPPNDDLVDTVRELTDGMGVDVAIEASGSPAALASTLDCLAFAGKVVVCSWYGTKPVDLPLGGSFHRNRLRIVSSQVGTIDPALSPRWNRTRRAALARDLLRQLDFTSLISHRVPFERAAEAYHLLDERPEEAIQVLVTYGDGQPCSR